MSPTAALSLMLLAVSVVGCSGAPDRHGAPERHEPSGSVDASAAAPGQDSGQDAAQGFAHGVTRAWERDPLRVDPDFPPAMAELRIDSHGSPMNAVLYLADGAGPHPTLVLLHGFPGNEKNLDLAQALRRAGFNVLFFHYRGSWGSAGDFGFGNAVQDVAAALAFLRNAAAATRYRVDSTRLGLVGHSMGGFAALKGAALDPDVGCVAAIAPWNLAVAARAFTTGPDAAARGNGFAASVDRGGALRGMSGAAAVAEILDRRDDFDLAGLGPALRGKSVLLVAAERDGVLPPAEHFDPLATAYASESGIDLTRVRLDGDHAFSWTRIALIRAVTDWATEHCGGPLPPTR